MCNILHEDIVTPNFVQTYPILTLYVHFDKKPAVKKWLPFGLLCAVYIVTMNNYPLVTVYKS